MNVNTVVVIDAMIFSKYTLGNESYTTDSLLNRSSLEVG